MRPPTVDGAPSWWRGEEEASTAFLRSVGATVQPGGAVTRP